MLQQQHAGRCYSRALFSKQLLHVSQSSVREANVLGGHLGTPVALPWVYCLGLHHVLSQISPDCFAQQQDVFVIDRRQYQQL